MRGPDFQRPSPEIIDILSKGSTASHTTIFFRKGIRDIWNSRRQHLQTISPHCPHCAPKAIQENPADWAIGEPGRQESFAGGF